MTEEQLHSYQVNPQERSEAPDAQTDGADLKNGQMSELPQVSTNMNTNIENPVDTNSLSNINPSDRNTWDMQRLMELDRSKNWREEWDPRMSMSFTNTKGLLNGPGDNNCFLNSAVQVLWHLDVFRRSFRMLSGHSCLGTNSCIFCALKVIFTQFQYSDQSCLPPDALRKALAKTFADKQRFQLGLMDDAAECFENILTQIHFHIANGESEDMCNAKHCISHQKFAMTIVEQIVCPCEATSEPHPFSQMVHYVSTSTLVSQAKAGQNGSATFGGLLKRAISEGDYRNCPSNCGRRVQLRRTLMNSPDIVSVGLVWDSENPSTDHIHDVVRNIGTTLQLRELFHNVVDVRCQQGSKLYLVGVVCYYGKHYSTFFYHSKMRTWVSFDDANIKEMGSQWSAVVDKCCRGHYQPLLLLYANPDGEPICTKTAPQKTVIVKETKFFNNNEENGTGPPGSYHCRQRSCDSLSGTVGGQCLEDFSYQDGTKIHRSMTPNPESKSQEVCLPARRAITPGPEWGHYDSDEEKPAVCHKRQSSYLNAFDFVDNARSQVEHPNQQTAPSAGQRQQNTRSDYAKLPVDEGGVQYAQHGKGGKGTVDLLGSLPQQQYPQQGNYGYQNNQYGSGQSSQYVPHGHHHSSAVYSAVSSQSTITSVACSTTTYQVAPSHGVINSHYSTASHAPHYGYAQQNVPTPHAPHYNGMEQNIPTSHGPYYGSPPKVPTQHAPHNMQQNIPTSAHYATMQQNIPTSHTPHYNGMQQNVPASMASHYNGSQQNVPASNGPHYSSTQQKVPASNAPPYSSTQPKVPMLQQCGTHGSDRLPQSAPNTPGMKRAQSAENTDFLAAHNAASRPTVSRSRPSSARPYDYGNSRPTVDPATGAINMPTRQTDPKPTTPVALDWEDGVLIGDFTTPDSCDPQPKPTTLKPDGTWKEQEEDLGSYINRKTVQNVLSIQKNRNSKPSISGNIGGIKTAPMHGSNTSLERHELKQQKAYIHNQALMRDLKVDIPGDNISLGSHKDSGYRSGGSSSGGDRNSASSASSVSYESPTADHFRGYSGVHRPLCQTYNSSSHSSSESLSSNQSGQTVKTLQNNRLSLIPENQPSSSSSSTVTKSQESLNNSQDGLDGYVSDRQLDHNGVSDWYEAHKQRELSKVIAPGQYQGPDAECQRLFLQAEAMVESSTKQEEAGDVHAALGYCNQAINCLQNALGIQGASNDTIVHVRMKHNSCVLRSRKLHKQILQRQQSNQSSISTASNQSMESINTGDFNSPSKNTETIRSCDKSRRSLDKHTIDLAERLKIEQSKQVYSSDDRQRDYSSSQQEHINQGNSNHVHQQNMQTCCISGIAQSRPVQGVTMGHANMPRSVTDSRLSQHNSQYPPQQQARPLSRQQEMRPPSQKQEMRPPFQQQEVRPPSQQQEARPPSRQRNHSASTELDEDNLNVNDTRHVELYGTLPKRKGKGTKSPQNIVADISKAENEAQIYQAYLQKQKMATEDVNYRSNVPVEQTQPDGNNPLINHSRQWSKDEIRDLLKNDFMNRPKNDNDMHDVGLAVPQPRSNATEPLDPGRPRPIGSRSHSRQNSYEDFLSRKMQQTAFQDPELPPKQRHLPEPVKSKPAVVPCSLKESHYDYLPLRANQNQSNNCISSFCGTSGMTIVGITGVPNQKPNGSRPVTDQGPNAVTNSQPFADHISRPIGNQASQPGVNHVSQPVGSHFSQPVLNHVSQFVTGKGQNISDSEVKQIPSDPYTSKRELPSAPKSTEENSEERQSAYPRPSAIKKMNKLNQTNYVKTYEIQRPGEQGKPAVTETVPINVAKPTTPVKPMKPVKPAKPEVPKRQTSQLSTFKGDISGVSSGSTNNMSSKGLAPPPYRSPPDFDCDLPPPPDELLYPPPISRPVTQVQQQQCTCDKELTNGETTYPGDGTDQVHSHVNKPLVIQNGAVDMVGGSSLPPSQCCTPVKPALTKKNKPTKLRKNVTFSENIALIATPEEMPEEIDYVAYVLNLGKSKSTGPDNSDDVDDDDNTSDSMDTDAVLCNLCRKKKIHPPEIYCEHCCFYMSQFQPQSS